jgi:hypothetical protein
MIGNDDLPAGIRMAPFLMAAALGDHFEAMSPKDPDYLISGESRQASDHQAGISTS